MSLLQQLLAENYSTTTKFKPSDVQSKLASIGRETYNNTNTDTTCFGLEDTNGQTIKVYVPDEQAKDFEASLSQRLSDIDPNDPSSPEIAEVLFSMRDRFDIVDVQWPKFSEDEEEQTPEVNSADQEGSKLEDPEADPMDGGGEEAPIKGPNMSGDGQQSELIHSVIQAMMADAEARRQEHLARAAEARAKEAEAAASMAEQKLKAEEEVADMEAYYDTQNIEKKEAKKLAKLAKYRHVVKQQDMEQGKFNDYGDALDDHEQQANQRMDQPSGKNPEGMDPDVNAGGGDAQYNTDDIDAELSDAGFENEEQASSDIDKKLNDIDATLRYLHSLRVQKQAHNG